MLASCAFETEALENIVRDYAADLGLSAGKLIHPLRLALTGGTSSPGLFDMMVVLGRDVCLRRLAFAMTQYRRKTFHPGITHVTNYSPRQPGRDNLRLRVVL